MLKTFLLTILLATFLFANESSALREADKAVKSGNKSRIIRAYNSYKNIYARALMSSDIKTQKKSLSGIIKSGRSLHIDVSNYQKRLTSLSKKRTIKKKKSIKKRKITQKKRVKSIKSRYIVFHNDTLTLDLKRNIRKKDIKYIWYYDKKTKQYIYRFTIKNQKIKKNEGKKLNSYFSYKLKKYKKNSVRFSLLSKVKLNIAYSIKNSNLKLSIYKRLNSKKTTSKDKLALNKYTPSETNYRASSESKIIVIDPGHGGKDAGAVGYRKYREKVVVLAVAKKIRDILQKNGHKVYMTRSNDTFIELKNRTKYANRKNADIFISIHANSIAKERRNKAYGIETYFLSPARSARAKNAASKENAVDMKHMNYFTKQNFLSIMNTEKIVASHKLAIDIQQGVLSNLKHKYTKIKDAGVREAPFWVLVGAQMPAVLVEIGFISHPMEAKRMVDKQYQNALAEGISDGVLRYIMKNP